MYLEDVINELFKMYPNFFSGRSKTSLRILSRNENKISYKICLTKFYYLIVNFTKLVF